VLAQLNAVNPEAVVVWASSDLGAKVAEEIRNAKSTLPVYLCRKGAVGAAASLPLPGVDHRKKDSARIERRYRGQTGGVWIVVSRQPEETDTKRDFTRRYRERTGNAPSIAALQAYDAVRLIAATLRQSGPNRARLRDRLAGMKDFAGVSGAISFDHAGNDVAAVTLTRLW
jgi:ABC-type branched-subunit amino acid transport system substrate-binding protein